MSLARKVSMRNYNNFISESGHIYRRVSTVYLGVMRLRFKFSIESGMPRKSRRALLLMLFKQMKPHLKNLQLGEIMHEDDPAGTWLAHFYHENKGADAIDIQTPEQIFGFRLRLFRTGRSMTQKQFAFYLGISHSFLSKIEHGKQNPSPELKERIFNLIRPSDESFPQTEPMPGLTRAELSEHREFLLECADGGRNGRLRSVREQCVP